MANRHDASREAYWRQMPRRRAQSGMTIAEFCESQDVTASAFYYWQRQIRRRDAASQSHNADPAGGPAFLPVQLVDHRRGPAAIEIVTTNGYVTRVAEQETTDHVRRVLQAEVADTLNLDVAIASGVCGAGFC